jgi:hypothetical protein
VGSILKLGESVASSREGLSPVHVLSKLQYGRSKMIQDIVQSFKKALFLNSARSHCDKSDPF